MSESIRIRTTPNGTDKYLTVKLDQDFDFIEILSLNINQEKAYENYCSDYGVIVGRVVVNSGFGIPNARVSVFIPITEEDKANPQISGLYPYETVNDKNADGIRYNLLPKESDNQDDCYTPIGTFPAKREFLDNDEMLQVYCKYYKYTTVTNSSGDFMLFGVPVGNHVLHVDADISDIGVASQKPYDLIDQGTPAKFFYSPTKFKESKNLNSLIQIKTANAGVNVQPFWGNKDNCEIGINRVDFDLNYFVRPAAIFIGSLFGDSGKNSVNKNCRPRKKLGALCEQVPREGTIEMIRKTLENQIEQFDIEGGRTIDINGAWAYQIPMNLDYVVTDEFGNLIPSENPNIGIPTRSSVRFRISMDEGGGTGRLRTRGKYLVPHNPRTLSEIDFSFDKTTKDESFTDIYWNKIYSVKNFISKVEKSGASKKAKTYTGIKDVDGCSGDKSPFPFNRTYTKNNVLFSIICFILKLIATLVSALNGFLCWLKGLEIAGWKPFKNVKPIQLVCQSEPETYWTPGCGDTVEQYTDCVSAVLAEQLDLFEFDFYNDWVNGTLYYYSLKYKKKRRGKEKFCETYCNDYTGGTGNNDCRNNQLDDTTFSNTNTQRSHSFKNGLLVKYGGVLYYPPILLDGSNKKLFSTDVVNLGAVLNCDWQGFPKVIDFFTNTSYKLPPLIQETEDNNSVVTGMIEIGNLYTGLFFDINCRGVSYDSRQAINIRRQCELNVDIPEVVSGATHATVTINEIYETNDPIDTLNSANRYVRDSFYLLNINGSDIASYPPINPLPDLSIPANGTSFGILGNTQTESHINGAAYSAFRDFNDPPTDIGFQSWGNSYFMYFGLIPGATALDKMKSKYFTSCVRAVTDDFIIETNVANTSVSGGSDGSIAFTFIGGTAPFTYTWTSTNYSYGPFTAMTGGIITGLLADVYTITAVDALGSIVVKNVIVGGPQPLACGFTILSNPLTLTSNDGKITITQLIGGTPPYTLVLTRPNSTTVTYQPVSMANSPLTGIHAGLNTLSVTDSSTPQQVCSQVLDVITAPPLTLQTPIQHQDISCNATCDGSINPIITGGVPPYIVRITGPNGYFNEQPYLNNSFIDLCQGLYTVLGTDSVSQTVTSTVNIVKAPVLVLGGTRTGNVIRYSATGGIPPYTYDPVDAGQIDRYTAPNNNPVVGTVTDSAGCTATHTFY